eukprot:scaffold923_cov256-Pinguiococcus_pyrenoidosus.AAC.11
MIDHHDQSYDRLNRCIDGQEVEAPKRAGESDSNVFDPPYYKPQPCVGTTETFRDGETLHDALERLLGDKTWSSVTTPQGIVPQLLGSITTTTGIRYFGQKTETLIIHYYLTLQVQYVRKHPTLTLIGGLSNETLVKACICPYQAIFRVQNAELWFERGSCVNSVGLGCSCLWGVASSVQSVPGRGPLDC